MTKVTKEQLLKFIRNNDLDLDESYPRSDWWKFRNERDSYRKQRDELINDMAETKRKAEAFDEIKKEKLHVYRLRWNELQEYLDFDYVARSICSVMYSLEFDLRKMDQLDGTHEFQKLLSDLERGSDGHN